MKHKLKFKKIISILLFLVASFFAKHKLQDQPTDSTNKKSSFKNIIKTKHAKCRMKCRHIDDAEIAYVLNSGKVNKRKSDPYKRPCPVVAKEAFSKKDRQNIRVIAAQCPKSTKIITVIDLDKNYDCYCK